MFSSLTDYSKHEISTQLYQQSGNTTVSSQCVERVKSAFSSKWRHRPCTALPTRGFDPEISIHLRYCPYDGIKNIANMSLGVYSICETRKTPGGGLVSCHLATLCPHLNAHDICLLKFSQLYLPKLPADAGDIRRSRKNYRVNSLPASDLVTLKYRTTRLDLL